MEWIRKVKQVMPWKLRLQTHLFFVKYPQFYIKSIQQKDDDSERVIKIFKKHMQCMKVENLHGKVLCELGPGQSLLHALLAYVGGVRESYFIDIDDLAGINQAVTLPSVAGMEYLPEVEKNEKWDTYLSKINAHYLTTGLEAYYEVPDGEVDYCFSEAVFEHIRRDILEETMKQINRMCKKGAVCCHVIDYRDHLGGGINHFRFPESKWESELYRQMPNYVNRVSHGDMIEMFERNGFKILAEKKEYWKKLPLDTKKMAKPYCDKEADTYMVKTACIVMKKI